MFYHYEIYENARRVVTKYRDSLHAYSFVVLYNSVFTSDYTRTMEDLNVT